MHKECKQCGKAFEATRDTATYCSATCRSKARVSVQNNNSVSVQKGDKVSVQDDNLSVQKVSVQNPEQTLCKGCQKPVRRNVEICHECFGKGMTRKSLNLPEVKREYFTDSPIKQMNWQRNKMTHSEALERAIYSIAEIGCDCIMGGKIYESKTILKKFKPVS